jgi:putative DNA primase/helicase
MHYADLTIETIQAALSFIDPDCSRDEWVQIGMSVKSELGDAGLDVWDAWSSTGQNYNQKDTRDTWRSIKSAGGVTIATLIHAAKSAGFKADGQVFTVTPEVAAARAARREADARREAEDRERGYARAAADADRMWRGASGCAQHPYISRKQILSTGAVRCGVYSRWHDGAVIEIPGTLLIPIRDSHGVLTGLQAYFPDADNPLGRDRDYLPGMRKQGCYFNIGKPTGSAGEVILIGEGYSTVASAVDATSAVGVVAFDAGNLAGVAAIIRAKLPDANIIILADNDRFTTRRDGSAHNPGMEAAGAAASACWRSLMARLPRWV